MNRFKGLKDGLYKEEELWKKNKRKVLGLKNIIREVNNVIGRLILY